MKNNKGFSLYEVMAALAVLSFVVASLSPMVVHIYKERMTIKEKRLAIEILHNNIELWLISKSGDLPDDKKIPKELTLFFLTIEGADSNEAKFCIMWNGSNERRYEKCGFAKPWP